MGISFSCPFATYSDLAHSLESVIVKSLDVGEDGRKTPVRSIRFRGQEPEPKTLLSLGSESMSVDGSASFRTDEEELIDSTETPTADSKSKEMVGPPSRSDSTCEDSINSLILDLGNPKNEAAIKLQKVYKSFRTRRKLADCAVLIEQSWWKLLDFAELKHSSISYFELEKHETAISRWSRARTRAAKVGKGLSKNGKARKLALQHWLEAIDPRHRYGHNLHFYYVKWLHSQSKQPFFYWLDIGEGKELNLVDKCPRWKLQQQCIKYLGPMERKAYEVVVEDGKFVYKQTGEILDTTGEPKGAKWIFVLSTSKVLYVGKKTKGTFQHSSFLAGGATLAAGRMVAENGILKAVWPHSGHYRPTPENFQDFVSFLRENNVDLSDVKLDSSDEEEDSSGKKESVHFRSLSEDDLGEKDGFDVEENDIEDPAPEKCNSVEDKTMSATSKSKSLHGFGRKLSSLEIPSKGDLLEILRSEDHEVEPSSDIFPLESPSDGDEMKEESFVSDENYNHARHDFPDEELDARNEEIISGESILRRISSRKGMKSYQLGEQLSCKWSTGSGPRIGCLRDYPSGLQSHALEQVNLSPRGIRRLRLDFPSGASAPASFSAEMAAPLSMSPLAKTNLFHGIICHSRPQSSTCLKGP